MNSKKYLLYVPFICVAMTLGACQQAGGGSTPVEPTVSSITIKEGAEPQKEFTVGDTFNVDGGKLVVTYSNQTTKDVNMTLSMIQNPPVMTAAVSSYTVNVLYEGATTSYNISIAEPPVTVTSIAIKQGSMPPQQFTVGDTFSVEGGVLVVTKSNDTREEVNMTLAMIQNAPDMTQAVESYTVNVLYEGARTSYDISIIVGDTRAEVELTVTYKYNGNPSAAAAQGLVFYSGEDYEFEYTANPEGALDSVSTKYMKYVTDAEPEVVGQPYEPGDYSYSVYIAEGDENYKPVEKTFTFSIIDQKEYVLNYGHLPTLGSEPSDSSADVDGVHFVFKNAKDYLNAEEYAHYFVLVDSNEKENYAEMQLGQFGGMFKGTLRVTFEGLNKYLRVYGSYDGEHYELLDTLSRAKQETDKINNYFCVRLVAVTFGEGNNEVIIKGISFKYEASGAPTTTTGRAEKTDKTNRISDVSEPGGYYRRGKEAGEVFDETRSTSSIGQKNQEVKARINFGFAIKARDLKKYNFSFNCKPSNIDNCIYREGSDAYDSDSTSIYAKLVSGTKEVGSHKKLIGINKADGWHKFDLTEEIEGTKPSIGTNMAARFIEGNPEEDITGIDIWISHTVYAADGSDAFACILIDDFRVFQTEGYPVVYDIDYLTVEDVETEYKLGDEFAFTGKVNVYYTDGGSEVVEHTDNRLSVEAPDMTKAGKQNVKVTFTDGNYSKSVTYEINVDGKAVETLPIVSDATDLADVSHRRNPELSTYMGCVVASNETTMTYGDSKVALRIGGPIAEEYCYITIMLPETINADAVTVKFFAKELPSNLILQLRDEEEKQKALYEEGGKPDVTTDQSKPNKFTATDAGNGWTLYEHDFYTVPVSNGVKVLRIMFRNVVIATQSGVLDGIEVFAKA